MFLRRICALSYWNIIFEYCEKIKYEIANLLVMVIISLRSFSSNPTAEDQTKVTASSS
jgi:hypothetical protein